MATIDTTIPNSPGWWLKHLLKKLERQRDRAERLETYFEGCNGIPVTADKAVKESYRRLMRLAGTNFAELIVEAVRERMSPVGFRTGAEGDDNGDAEAWRIWQANGLDADAQLVHRAMLSMADGYIIVGPPDPEIGAPVITPEDPREVVTAHDPIRKRKTVAALKVFHDETTEQDRAFLYLPGMLLRFEKRHNDLGPVDSNNVDAWRPVDGMVVPFDDVPVVRFANRAKLNGHSLGEFEPHLTLLDRINYTVLSRLEIATLQAFRQRALEGGPTHDAAGNEIDYDNLFAADPGAFWHLPEGAKLWESGVVDLGPIRQAIRDDVQDLAAVTRTPLYYLTPDSANGSAEGASLAREGLVFKTEDRISATTEAWERVMALAFRFAGDEQRAQLPDLEVMWAPADRQSLAARYDAAVKAKTAGVTWREIMLTVLGFSPQAVARMESDRSADILFAAAMNPTSPTAAPNGL